MGNALIYGSYGYSGQLIVATAVERGIDPVLAGRDTSELERQAVSWGLEHRSFGLDDPDSIEQQLGSIDVVLNCAGPFVHTYEPLVEACLETGTHYLDLTGEIEVFEAIAAYDDRAKAAGVTLLPGVGFDVVPTDCLAMHLRQELSEPTQLTLGFDADIPLSRGTALTMIEWFQTGGAIRENGTIRRVPLGWKTRRIDFGEGPHTAVTIPWGDVSTAYRTTGVENIEFYLAYSPLFVRGQQLGRYLSPVLGFPPLNRAVRSLVKRTISGPDAATRRQSGSRVWGEITDGERTYVARLTTPNGYDFTAKTAVECMWRTMDRDVPVGYQTPALAFGADFILEFDGVTRQDAR